MKIEASWFDAVKLLKPERHEDGRGFFSETWNRRDFAALGIDRAFVQDNHSLSRGRSVVRGLHFQLPPFAQAKLVRVARGSILDVAVDVRRGSPNFGRHAAATLSAANGLQLFIPPGFAHGFCTLEPDSEVLYKVDAYYSRAHERGVRWNDPALGIAWPVRDADAEVSEKDRLLPALSELADVFE
ncbi:MAG TPA: dTDP-4-dehydrorhamnose 3,5-epimerase [Rhizomicrobium sp.]|jgi:dTDP-4-dehydrorhamnose 3,5-epimerase|nr:dTDP-4-dehydrorhamnose 3,5-epimerase [Rhizomicrobium sp.]